MSIWKKIQITLAVFLVLAGLRVYLIYRERHEVATPKPTPSGYSNKDYYVSPHKLRAYDLKSLRSGIVGKTIWVHAGNQLVYYPYSAATHHVDFKHDKQVLPPIAALHVDDVMTSTGPASPVSMHALPAEPQLMILFKMDGSDSEYAVSAGTPKNGDASIYFDDVFFIEDPHQLYKHWPPDVWTSIDQHQVKEGMSELQTAFALGTDATLVGGDKMGDRTLEFPNNGKPLQISFRDDKIVRIEPVTK